MRSTQATVVEKMRALVVDDVFQAENVLPTLAWIYTMTDGTGVDIPPLCHEPFATGAWTPRPEDAEVPRHTHLKPLDELKKALTTLTIFFERAPKTIEIEPATMRRTTVAGWMKACANSTAIAQRMQDLRRSMYPMAQALRNRLEADELGAQRGREAEASNAPAAGAADGSPPHGQSNPGCFKPSAEDFNDAASMAGWEDDATNLVEDPARRHATNSPSAELVTDDALRDLYVELAISFRTYANTNAGSGNNNDQRNASVLNPAAASFVPSLRPTRPSSAEESVNRWRNDVPRGSSPDEPSSPREP
ncbi:hypothetical protein B0A49_06049 [Cryomyces minteri]|uniref:Uncharacterized protein n=1 Tax=Cryomyces minteri TaxID=331657 RepID=A0A4U0WR43_9PEZI|nr:hypothetical protein B0A49_06747 [Cryomyces minteri]TKA72356.1 hypothetical protein B0A49_06049 [Cryomyces minteri]